MPWAIAIEKVFDVPFIADLALREKQTIGSRLTHSRLA